VSGRENLHQIGGDFWGDLTGMVRIGVRKFQRTSKNMTNENTLDPKIIRIRQLAGEIGSHHQLEKASDAENYDFQVKCGLGDAVADIFQGNPHDLFEFFGYCLISIGINLDKRVDALLDATEREVLTQYDFSDEEEEAA
jgi:hypothetical protein